MKTYNLKEETFDAIEALRSKDQTQDEIVDSLVKFFVKEAKIADDMDKLYRAKLKEVLPEKQK